MVQNEKKKKVELFDPVKRMTFGDFHVVLKKTLINVFGDTFTLQERGPWLWITDNNTSLSSSRYRLSAIYTDYLNLCEKRCTPHPFQEEVNWFAANIACDLQRICKREIVPAAFLENTSYQLQRTTQEINPAIAEKEGIERAEFVEKLKGKLQNIFYDEEIDLNVERLRLLTEGSHNLVVEIQVQELWELYNRYQDEGVKNPAKKVAKYAEKKYDEQIEERER